MKNLRVNLNFKTEKNYSLSEKNKFVQNRDKEKNLIKGLKLGLEI